MVPVTTKQFWDDPIFFDSSNRLRVGILRRCCRRSPRRPPVPCWAAPRAAAGRAPPDPTVKSGAVNHWGNPWKNHGKPVKIPWKTWILLDDGNH